MSFKTKTDYFGIAATGIEVQDDAENATINTAEARGENGFVVAVESYGERKQPSNTYAVTKNSTLASVVLGDGSASGNVKNILTSVSISTSAGGVPTITASGTQVPTAAVLTGGCKVTLASIAISALHHAQLFKSITVTGNGAHVTQSSYSATCDISTAECDGVIKAFDIVGGKETVSVTIQVSDSAYGAPTVTLPSGWQYTTPLTLTNPNGDFPTWTFTAEHPLAADVANSSNQ